jgi:hypothetical protein
MATRADYEKRSKAYYKAYYGQLKGVTIEAYLGMEKDDYGNSPFPKFKIKYPNGKMGELIVSRDEEGNGGGFLFLPYEPNMEQYDKTHKLNKYEEKE